MNSESFVKGFQFTPIGIAGILKSHRLKVPPYQREYSWTFEEVGTLYSDYTRAKTDNTDYFLGTIVTVGGPAGAPLEIIDGQQRLTTTALLIAAIRDYFEDIGQPQIAVNSITNEFISTFDRRQNHNVSRLMLNIDDQSFFEKIIDNVPAQPSRESHRLLLDAKKKAREHVRDLVRAHAQKDHVAVLNDWIDFLEHNATVILVETQSAAQAFKMFETLNDRGLKTTQADLVKSYLFGHSGSRIQEAQARWSSLKDSLEEIADDDRTINFLRHFIIATRKFVRTEGVYEEAQTIRGEINSISFLSELERGSRVYVATYRPGSSYWNAYPAATQKGLSEFNRFDIKPMRPLVLSAAMTFTEAEFSKAIEMLVSVSVRLIVAGNTRSGSIETNLATVAVRIHKKEIFTAAALREAMRSVLISDTNFREQFARLRVSKADLARYYLHTLEATFAGEDEPWYVTNDDPAQITLEHVMPTNASLDKWPNADDDTKQLCCKRLGNMCLLKKTENNNDAGSESFAVKRGILGLSPYALTSEVAGETAWSLVEIDKRQAKLADLAVSAWAT